MAIKAVNNTTGFNRLVPTLLVYKAYLRMSNLDPPAPSITEWAAAIQKVMAEIVKLWAKQTVSNTLHHRNGPNMTPVYNLPLNSKVLVWCKSGNWTRPYRLLAVENKIYCVQLLSGLTSFKSISIKPYFWPKDNHNIKLNKPETTTKLDKLEVLTELNKLEVLLPTLEVP